MPVQSVTTYLTLSDLLEIFPVDASSLRKWCRVKKGIFLNSILNSQKEWLVPENDVLEFTGGSRRLLNSKQAAETLEVSASEIRRLIATQELKSVRIDRLFLVTQEEIDKYKKEKAENMTFYQFQQQSLQQQQQRQQQLHQNMSLIPDPQPFFENPVSPVPQPTKRHYKHSEITYGMWNSATKEKLSTTVIVNPGDDVQEVLKYAKNWVESQLKLYN